MSPVKIPTRVEYKAIPVKEILKDMKNFSSLMVDLAYYSLVYNDKKLANEVLRIEEYVDSLWNLLVMQASLSVRDAEDAESMVGVMKLASATNKISDAAGDLAILTLLNMPLQSSVRATIRGGEEAVSRIKIRNESKIVGLTLGNAFSKLNIALDVIAVRKGYTWIFAPREDYKLELGSVLIVRGPKEAIDKLRIAAKDYVSLEETVEVEEVEEEIAKDLIRLKDIGEFMLDLAYLATLTNNRDLALEVLELEEYVDQIHIDLERKVVRKLRKDNPDEVVSILRTIISLENIADATSSTHTVRIDIYRFNYYYLTSENPKTISDKQSYCLVEWRSVVYADYKELMDIQRDSVQRANTVKELVNQGISYCWDPFAIDASAAFFSMGSDGSITPNPGHTIQKDKHKILTDIRTGIMGSGYKYGISPNTSGWGRAPAVVPQYASASGNFPGGLEVIVIGSSMGRKVLVRTVLVAQGSMASIIGNDQALVCSVHDVW